MQKVAQALWRDVLPATPVFTTRGAAAAAHVGMAQASRDLGRLARLDLITRVSRGVWADTRSPRFSPYAAVPALLALRTRRTAIGTFRFHLMRPDLVAGFEIHPSGTFALATPTKALFDTLYYSARKGARYAHLPEVTLPVGFRHRELAAWIARVESAPLRVALTQRWKATQLAVARQGRAAR